MSKDSAVIQIQFEIQILFGVLWLDVYLPYIWTQFFLLNFFLGLFFIICCPLWLQRLPWQQSVSAKYHWPRQSNSTLPPHFDLLGNRPASATMFTVQMLKCECCTLIVTTLVWTNCPYEHCFVQCTFFYIFICLCRRFLGCWWWKETHLTC